jgi:hypothetical protein
LRRRRNETLICQSILIHLDSPAIVRLGHFNRQPTKLMATQVPATGTTPSPNPDSDADDHLIATKNVLDAIQQNHLFAAPKVESPPPALFQRRPFQEISPFCVSTNNLINPLPSFLFYGSGWYAHRPFSACCQRCQFLSHSTVRIRYFGT